MRDVTTTQPHPSVEPVAPDKRFPSQRHRGSMKRMAMVSLLTGTIMLAPLLTSAHPLSGEGYDPSAGTGNVDVYILDTGIYIEHNSFAGRAQFTKSRSEALQSIVSNPPPDDSLIALQYAGGNYLLDLERRALANIFGLD